MQKRTYLNDFICPLEGSLERGKGSEVDSEISADAVSPTLSPSNGVS